ncbi:MAG: hypothetical protein LBP95_11525 [Deltaproteobacteria bacterium]|jgi:hypothetical protein|nr:hypothetical protein [Deltaproteobacteria bacterium]
MELGTAFIVVVGLPLVLVALGFFLLCLKWLLAKDQRARQAQILDAAVRLDASLSKLETRLTALEDILLPPPVRRENKRGLGGEFDRELDNAGRRN